MRNSNKGFTLVEMLLTLAILSVVMVGVISIMRSSSSFYKTGVKEVDLQEEAQIATAQIENMLVDATSNVTYSGGAYNLVLSDGQSVSLKRDATKKQLLYKVGSSAFQPMADYVEAFSIDGLAAGVGSADNKVTVNLTMSLPVKTSNDDTDSFKVSKEVYFRNLVEDKTSHNIQFNGVIGSSNNNNAENSEFYHELEILRYEPVNISREFFTENPSNITILANTNGIYELDTKNDGVYVKLTTAYSDMFTSAIGVNGSLGLSYVDGSGVVRKVRLYTKPVKISDQTKVFWHHNQTTQNSGCQTYIDVEGININNALKAGVDLQYKMSLKVDGSVINGSNGSSKTIKKADSDKAPECTDMQFRDGIQRDWGLAGDPNSRGIILTTGNPAVDLNNESKLKNNYSGNDALTITFNFKNSAGNLQINGETRTYKLYITGLANGTGSWDGLKNFQ